MTQDKSFTLRIIILSACAALGFFYLVAIASAEDICFQEVDASRLVVELEQGRICTEELNIAQQAMAYQEEQMHTFQSALSECDLQVKSDTQVISKLNAEIEKERKEYKEIIEAQKPTFWQRVENFGQDVLIIAVIIGGVVLFAR